jgi:O-antigen/teichoic acid export membrane protein
MIGDVGRLRPTGVLFLARVSALGAGLLAVLVTARLYGPDGRGVIAAFAVLQFLGATGLAFGSGSGAFLAAHRRTHRGEDIGRGLIAFAAGIGTLTIAVAGLAWITGIWSVTVPGTSLAVAIALGPAVAGQYLVIGGSQLAIGEGDARRAAVGWVLGPLLVLVSVLLAYMLGMSLDQLLLLQAIAWAGTGLAFILTRGARLPSIAVGRQIVRIGRGAALGDITNALSYRLDVLLVVWLAGSAAAGVYSLATQLMEPIWLLATSASAGLLIDFRSKDERARMLGTARTAKAVLLLTTAGVVAVVAFLPVAAALAGPGFLGAIPAGIALGPGIILLAVARVLAAYQTSLGRLWLGSLIATVAVIVAIAFDVVLIPPWGAVGAAVGASVSYGVACLLWFVAFRTMGGVSLDLRTGSEADRQPGATP